VPGGFATTADAFREFIEHNGLKQRIFDKLATLDVEDVPALAKAGAEIRGWVIDAPLHAALDAAIRAPTPDSVRRRRRRRHRVAVRSSATAEDLPDASFAGQQETFLNVIGADDVLHKVKEVFASLYNDRAIAYRVHHGFKHEDVFLSAGVQLMVRSDVGASGVLFTLDTESGFRDVVFVTASYGLGETVVQGAVNPDEFYVYKPTLRAGKPAILRRQLGSKQIRMVYSNAARRARAHRGHAGRTAQPLLDQRRRRARALAPGAGHRTALRPPDGHRVGARTASPASSTSCRRARRR
jgi:pyruvate,water dikinase